ncbi:DUF6479 family protein [Streptomyces sp. NPDC020983]|uniref:DUF6479 family protein n=1 Tax=Streptomyces sp. NPDC020983 TaxID=3365106 RepID=UPI0037A86D53
MITAVRQTTELASSSVTAWAVIFGVIIVGVLILAFWWGARALQRRRGPVREPQPRAGSWHEPQEGETHHTMRSHGEAGSEGPGWHEPREDETHHSARSHDGDPRT